MKTNIDALAMIAGVVGAFLKSLKNWVSWKMTLIQMVVGAILGFGTIGVLSIFMDVNNAKMQLIILIAFALGWAANEITDILDKAVKEAYEAAKIYGKRKKQ